MAATNSTSIRILVPFAIIIVPLGLLAGYLWRFDYNPTWKKPDLERHEAGAIQRDLKAELVLEPADAPGGRVCRFEVTNDGARKHRLLDLTNPGKILLVRATYLGTPEKPASEALKVRPEAENDLYGEGGFDNDRDGIVDLLPGACWRKRLDLAGLFDLSRPGAYEVKICYDSQRFAKDRGVDPAKWGAFTGRVEPPAKRFVVGPPPAEKMPEKTPGDRKTDGDEKTKTEK